MSFLIFLLACQAPPVAEPGDPDTSAPAGPPVFVLAEGAIPPLAHEACMDVGVADVDADGDIDVVLANEFQANVLLLNDGGGRFTERVDAFAGDGTHDHEDVAFGDVDGDGVIDVAFAAEDDQHSELWLGVGDGTFVDATDRLPPLPTADAVELHDLDGDGDLDVFFGGHGQDVLLVNAGDGTFSDGSAGVPDDGAVTQDLAVGDLDGDGDPDMVLAGETAGGVLMNAGGLVFELVPLPTREAPAEARKAALGDVDGDGDLDLVLAIVGWQDPTDPARAQDRLLLNDGAGGFAETTDRLPVDEGHTLSARLADADADGDLDLFTSEVTIKRRALADGPYRLLVNDGGTFTDASAARFLNTKRPAELVGHGLDLEPADLNGDGLPDVYLCDREAGDRLLLGVRP